MNCPKHPNRPVINPMCVDTQVCEECRQERKDRWADAWDYERKGHDYKAIYSADGNHVEQVRK